MGSVDRTDSDADRLSGEELFEVLGSRPRRLALFHLRQHGHATIEELSEVVASLASTGDQPPEEAIERARTELYHRDLPMLEHHGLVSVHSDDELVHVEPLPTMVAEWLDLATRQELRYEEATTTDEEEAEADEQISVLLVDDDRDYLDLAVAYLEAEDIDVTTATNALDAFSALEGDSFDCVISDYKMPSVDGLELLSEVRSSYPNLPFLLLTNKGNESVASDAIRAGVSDYVVKGTDPTLLEELGDRVRSLHEPKNGTKST